MLHIKFLLFLFYLINYNVVILLVIYIFLLCFLGIIKMAVKFPTAFVNDFNVYSAVMA